METSLVTIEHYIENTWQTLTRTTADLVEAASDPKLEGEAPLLYIAPTEDRSRVEESLKEAGKLVELRVLPEDILSQPNFSGPHGLLYLPHSYIVPGGRFNEMYGWDSYFINLGLLAQDRVDAARKMVDNHLYQVRHYGCVLNANRTYYLTRSQPPFLASMVRDIYQRTGDAQWLGEAFEGLESTYRFWMTKPHLTPETGLSRYIDLGSGPAPEVIASERDEEGLTHYQRIEREYARIVAEGPEAEAALGYDIELFYDRDSRALKPLFYVGDRSMRESGFDPSDRFGRFNVDVVHYNPVDLNSLLYLFERDMVEISQELGFQGSRVARWADAADSRRALMQKYLWNPEAETFEDYNFLTQKRRPYPFATAYFPLWTGWATQQQADSLAGHLNDFLQPGGVVTSLNVSGNQWDKPFGWAPLQLVAADGLKKYGYEAEAKEIATRFLDMVQSEYQRTGTILEKYDVEARSSSVSDDIQFGYSSNEVGFGWTNGVYLALKNV